MKQVKVLEAGLVLEDRVEPHHVNDIVSLTDDQYARLPRDVFGVAVADASPGGSSQPGAVRVVEFDFAFDTPGLTDGVVVYTPAAAGEVIVGMAIVTTTEWDGTTPKADISTYVGGQSGFENYGMFGLNGNGPIPMDVAPSAGSVLPLGFTVAGRSNDLFRSLAFGGVEIADFVVMDTDNPLKVVVSQTGLKGGADPGATQGAAKLLLSVCTPAISA